MKKLVLPSVLIFLSWLNIPAQELNSKSSNQWTHSLTMEGGFIFPMGSVKDDIAIRQNVGSYYVYQSSRGYVSSESYGLITGIRWELYNPGIRVGISAGLRYTGYNSSISGSASGSADFFYLRYSRVGSETKFARVNEITENIQYLSIPLELTYVAFQYHEIGFFIKAGSEFSGYKLRHETDLKLQNAEMEIHKKEILSDFKKPSGKFYSTLYGSFGMQYVRENKSDLLFEVFLPATYLNRDIFTLLDVSSFAGFRFSVRFPVTKSKAVSQ